jgi:hypothetical protein
MMLNGKGSVKPFWGAKNGLTGGSKARKRVSLVSRDTRAVSLTHAHTYLVAMNRYYEMLGAKDAWSMTDDTTESDDATSHNNDVRPTVSARQLKALVEQVTDRYSPLPNFTHRTRFLIDAQIPLLEGYYSRISSSLDAFESLSSSLVRAVPGALGTASNGNSGGRLTAGVEGIMRLCKALVSARYISTAMDVWGEDLVRSSGYILQPINHVIQFFLELWTEINHKASLRARAETHPSLPDLNNTSSDAVDGTIFEELVQQYEKLVIRTEEMIVQQICTEVEAAWKTHFARCAPAHSPSRRK